jgi:uncharacterized small protein (DUF1192 family)
MARIPRTHAIGDECLKRYHAELSISQMPATFQQLVKNIDARIPSTDIWGTRYKFVREALALAEFTQLMPVTSVRLGEDPPDGWINLNSDRRVEIVEAIEPGRRRGDEYRADRIDELDYVSMSELEERIRKLEPELERVIRKKVGKYDPQPMLLVDLNIVDHDRAQKQVEDAISRLKSEYAESFDGISVIWKGKLY